MNVDERIDLLVEAQEKLHEAIDNIEQALEGTSHRDHADAYIIGHLRNWANNDNPYDYGIPKYIEILEEEGIDEFEEE